MSSKNFYRGHCAALLAALTCFVLVVSDSLAGNLPACAKHLTSDRKWSMELTLVRAARGGDLDGEVYIIDGTKDETPKLQRSAERYAHCVAAAINDMHAELTTKIHVVPLIPPGPMPPKPINSSPERRQSPPRKPAHPQVSQDQSPTTARCLGQMSPGAGWRAVLSIPQMSSTLNTGHGWSWLVALDSMPADQAVDEVTQFARCIARAWELSGIVEGPVISSDGKQLQYKGAR